MQDQSKLSKKRAGDRLFAWYERQQWLRALIQAVPLGGSADTLLSWRAINLNKQRINELCESISERLSTVEELSLNIEFLQSEEFFELFRSCAEITMRTASVHKRKYVADFLVGTIKEGHLHDLSQQIAEDLRILQDFHLLIIASIPESSTPNILAPEKSREVDKIINVHALKDITGMDWGILNKGLSDLKRLGFIHYSSEATAWEGGDVKVCRVTQYLNIFKDSLT